MRRGDGSRDRSDALKREEGTRSQAMWASLEAGKGREMGSFLEPPEGTPSCRHLDFNPVKPTPETSDQQIYKFTNLCCLGPLSVWSFVNAVVGN